MWEGRLEMLEGGQECCSFVACKTFSFESLGGIQSDARVILARSQGVVILAALSHDGMASFTVVWRVSFTIASRDWEAAVLAVLTQVGGGGGWCTL